MLVFPHSGRRLYFLFVQSITLLIILSDNHGVLEFLSQVTVVCGIHFPIIDMNLCCHKNREESMSSVNMESQPTESISSQALYNKISILVIPNLSFVVSRCGLRVPSFQLYLNRGMIRVAERGHIVASNQLRHIRKYGKVNQ